MSNADGVQQRIPLVPFEELSGELAEAAKGPSGKSSFFRLQAQAPTAFAAYRPFTKAIFAELDLSEIDRELVVLLTAKLQRGEYVWAQHERIALALGVPSQLIDAISKQDLCAPGFSKSQIALLAFTKQVVEDVRVDDDTYAAMSNHYPDREIVETLYTIGSYMLLLRISEVARLPLDDLTGLESLRAAKLESKKQ